MGDVIDSCGGFVLLSPLRKRTAVPGTTSLARMTHPKLLEEFETHDWTSATSPLLLQVKVVLTALTAVVALSIGEKSPPLADQKLAL